MVWKLLALSGILLAAGSLCWTFLRERKLHRRRREQTLFYASLGHELKTPLNCIVGFSELLGMEDCPEELRKNAARDVHFASKMLLTMIDDMLDCAKFNAGRMRLHPSGTELKRFADELPPLLDHQLREKNLRLEIGVPPDAPRLFLDPCRMRQILLNLAGNAVKYSDRGVIRLRFLWNAASPGHGALVIKVSDQGHGIPKSEQKRIFEPFVQQKAHAAAGSGAGLGLSITLRLVRLMNGTIELESEVGKGSCFTVKIPDVAYEKRLPDAGHAEV